MASALGMIDEVFVLQGLDRFSPPPFDATVPQNAILAFRGWAAHPQERPGSDLAAFVDGVRCGFVAYGLDRDDLVEHYRNPSMKVTGMRGYVEALDLALGKHELRLRLDGACELPPLQFSVTEPNRTAGERARSDRFAIDITALHSEGESQGEFARVQRPLIGTVRGSIEDIERGEIPEAIYTIVDGFDLNPAKLEGSAERLRFLGAFITESLSLGPHELQIATKIRGSRTLVLCAPIPFAVTPLSLQIGAYRLTDTLAVASCSWADESATSEQTNAQPRAIRRGDVVHVRGWAIDSVAKNSAEKIAVQFGSGRQFLMEARQIRADVADRYGTPAARFCGFVGSIATGSLAPGRNVGRIFVLSKDGARLHGTDATVTIDIFE